MILLSVILLGQNPGYAQVQECEADSVKYYEDYSSLLALRIYINTKWNTLDIIRDDQKLSLVPNSPTSLGVGFNYKEYGLAIAFGLPKSDESKRKFGHTNRLDLQVNAYGRKFGFDGIGQIYKGYYHSNPSDFMDWTSDEYPKLPDMRVLSIGVNAFYIFNSEKFSYKAAFVRNQVQRISSGSITLGMFGNFDASKTENGFKPTELPDSVGRNLDLKAFNTLALGINIGYLFTWVITDNLFINIGITPGFGNQRIELETIEEIKSVKNAPAAQIAARGAIGYDTEFFYVGITAMTIWRNFHYKGYDLDLATEQFKVFIGKRFQVSRKH